MKVEIGDNGVWIMEGKWRNDLQKISARGKYCGNGVNVTTSENLNWSLLFLLPTSDNCAYCFRFAIVMGTG